ncbi:MAG TPA: type III pantothenate kinase [Polyangiaceae bacterium]
MLLAIDIGNTHIKFGLFAGKKLEHKIRLVTDQQRTEDEYGVLLVQALAQRGLVPESVDSAIVASVVPELTDGIVAMVRRLFGREPLVLGPGLKTGMPILYDSPREVGPDRIADAVAAYERFHGAAIVVDFGTATTFNCISPKGEYLGGVIVPGIRVALDALLAAAAKLSRAELTEPPRVLGRNTAHALQSGAVHGSASLVDGLVERLEAELGFPCEVIATGGLATVIAKHSKKIGSVAPDLTLEGLRILHERNCDANARRPNEPAEPRRPKSG